MAKLWTPTGVLFNELSQLGLYGDSSGMQVKVRTGRAWMRGHFYESDAERTLPIATADATNPRIDRVVLRADFVANTIGLAVLQGVPAATPTAALPTTNDSMWEIGLGTVTVPAGATTIAAENVTADTKLTPLGTGIVSTTETTTSTVYGNLATVGPDVHIEVSDASAALVTITSRIQCDTAGQHAFMGFELSGSQSVAAGDATALAVPGANMAFRLSASYVVTGLARGGYRFRGRYRVTGGTGTFSQRSLIVTPL
jgi:hypothetical protein